MEIQKICALGRQVIQIEADAVSKLVERIDQKFADACLCLRDCRSRLAIMGMGKSGQIGKKLAATFASTGTPAFFIHPGEAKHGDIGMLTAGDVLLVLSNSGESDEILCLIPAIKRLGIPLIALTGRADSTLALAATIHLDVSVAKEACPLGLAPTSSTTAALAMGDALAMVTLELKGFTHNDFALSHPGGTLGRKLLLHVEEIMHKHDAIPITHVDATLKDALVTMTQKKLGMTTIINLDQELVGIFTDGDVRRALDKHTDVHTTRIDTVMSKNPKTIAADTLAVEALSIMESFKITSLVITDLGKKPVGVIHIHDLLRAGIV